MFETLRNAWKIPDLRKKILFTAFMLLVFRIGSYIPVPGLSRDALKELVGNGNSVFGFIDIVTGGAFSKATIFAMSITPYVNSSIIMQLLTVAIPRLEQLSKEGEEGRKKLGQYMRYGTVILGFLQALALYFSLRGAVMYPGFMSFLTITLTFTAGTAFLMWLGEQITDKGIGNGISLIIFAGILSRGPAALNTLLNLALGGTLGVLGALGIVLFTIVVIAAVAWVTQGERRIPVQYAKRVVGRKMYGGQSTHIPIKVNLAGVIPIIFAMSIMTFPSTIAMYMYPRATAGFGWWLIYRFPGSVGYAILYGISIIAFTFFSSILYFNPIELANNMRKNGGFIPGIRPGKPTSDYISKVLNRVTWFGAVFLALIACFPMVLSKAFANVGNVWFGSTSVLILVSVALETVRQLESQMLMRHYKGFLE